MKLLAGVCGLWAVSAITMAEQAPDDALRGALSSAKIAGSCSMFLQMVSFQQATKMPGGDEFLERFYGMELARLGISPDQYAKMCGDATRVLNYYTNEIPPAPK
ncbi:hypothetical protein D3C77_649690 [compost metagenome]